MKQSQLLSILCKLTPRELRAFQHYVEGLYPNRTREQELLNYLSDFHPNFEQNNLTLEGMESELFGTTNKRKKILNMLSDLKLLAIEFLLWKKQKEPSFEQSLSLIQLLYDREMDKVAEAELNKLVKITATQKQTNPLHLYQLLKFKYFCLTVENNTDALPERNLNESLKQLNVFYLTNACKLFCELLNRKTVYQEIPLTDIKIVEQALASSLTIEPNDLLSCYQKALAMNLHQSQEAYRDLSKLYVSCYNTFAAEDQLTLLLTLINFCIPKVMQGIPEYEADALALHELGFTTKLLFSNNKLSKTIFLNTVTIGCRLSAWDWVNKIIAENTKYLEVNNQEETGKIAQALVEFSQKNYETTLTLLHSISVSKDLDNSLRIRGLIALSLFEIKSTTVLLDHLKSFESFLRNNAKQLSTAIRERYQKFIKITRLLLKRPVKKQKIIAHLNESSAVFAKSFLLSKIKDVNL